VVVLPLRCFLAVPVPQNGLETIGQPSQFTAKRHAASWAQAAWA